MRSLEETLTCPICMDLFDDPRLLPCSHTFCCKCLHSTINNRSFFTCPLCRSHFFQQILPVNRIVLSLVEQFREENSHQHRSMFINAKCYDCKSYEKLDLCCHCDTLLCNKCFHRHDIDWKNENYRTIHLLLSKITWLKFKINIKKCHEKRSIFNQRLNEIEFKLKNYHHPCNRQQFHENRNQMKTIQDDLRFVDKQLEEKFVDSPTCDTPLSAGSSGYGSDMN